MLCLVEIEIFANEVKYKIIMIVMSMIGGLNCKQLKDSQQNVLVEIKED